MTDESMFPEYPDEPHRTFVLDPATIRATVSTPKPDNSAYLAAMREFRDRYHEAERVMGGSISIKTIEFKRAE